MPRPPVEIDDKHWSAKSVGAPQLPNAGIAAEVIEDQAALPFFAVFGDYDARADIASAKWLTALEPSLVRP